MRKRLTNFLKIIWAALLLVVWLKPQTGFAQAGKVGYPAQCTNNATNPTSAEWLTCTQMRAGTTMANPLYTSSVSGATAQNQIYDGSNWVNWRGGLINLDNISPALTLPYTGSMSYFFDGTAWARWLGTQSGADNVSNSIRAPWVRNFNMVYDGTTWDRMTMVAVGDSLSATYAGFPTLSFGLFFDGTNYRRWLGSTVGADNLSNTIAAPYTRNFNMVYDGSTWDRMTASAAGDALSTTSQGLNTIAYNAFSDGSNYRRWTGEAWDTSIDVTIAPAVLGLTTFYETGASKGYRLYGTTVGDSLGNPIAPFNISLGTFYNGTNYQRWTGQTMADNMTATPVAPYTISFGTFYNGTNYQRWTGQTMADNMTATPVAPFNISFSTFYNGTNFQRWTGQTMADNMSATPVAPYTISFGTFYNGTNYQRWTGQAIADNMSATQVAPFNISLGTFYNGTNYQRWTGQAIADNMAAAQVAPFNISLGTFYNGTNYQRWLGAAAGANSVSNSTASPWVSSFLYGYNGSTWDRLVTITTQADAQGATTDGLVTSSFLYGYNGTNFDLLRVGASNELQVTDIATRPGEDVANDYRKVRIDNIFTYTPAKKAATAVDNSGTDIVVDSIQVIGYSNFCVYVKNLGGGGGAAFNDVQIQTSPDNSSWTADLGWTSCDTSASGVTCVYCVSNNSYNYIRVTASTAASSTTADGWLVSNKG